MSQNDRFGLITLQGKEYRRHLKIIDGLVVKNRRQALETLNRLLGQGEDKAGAFHGTC